MDRDVNVGPIGRNWRRRWFQTLNLSCEGAWIAERVGALDWLSLCFVVMIPLHIRTPLVPLCKALYHTCFICGQRCKCWSCLPKLTLSVISNVKPIIYIFTLHLHLHMSTRFFSWLLVALFSIIWAQTVSEAAISIWLLIDYDRVVFSI